MRNKVVDNLIQGRSQRLCSRVPNGSRQIASLDADKIHAVFLVRRNSANCPEINADLRHALLGSSLNGQAHLQKKRDKKIVKLSVFLD